jgi:hypothetical protein
METADVSRELRGRVAVFPIASVSEKGTVHQFRVEGIPAPTGAALVQAPRIDVACNHIDEAVRAARLNRKDEQEHRFSFVLVVQLRLIASSGIQVAALPTAN